MKKKLHLIIGARPNFIKLIPLINIFEKLFELSKGGIEKLIDFQSKAIKSE